MNVKSTLGILAFMLFVLCIFHFYNSSERYFSYRGNTIDPDFRSTSGLLSYSNPDSDHTNEQGHPEIAHEQSRVTQDEELSHKLQEKPPLENEAGDFYQHLKNRIAGLEAPNSLYYQHHLETQRQRHAQLSSVCSTMKEYPFSLNNFSKMNKNIWVNDKYKFVYCSTPKAACTSWKSVLLVLEGITASTDEFSQKTINSQSGRLMKQLWQYPEEEQERIMKTYTKFMISRDPFSRLLSAFRNKLSPNTTFERARKWQHKLGRKIISRYGKNSSNRTQYDLKFSEFVRYVRDAKGPHFNKHWSLQHMQCRPCDVDYTILGHFETLEEDSKFILKVIGAENIVSFPSSNNSSPTNSSDKSVFTSYYDTLTLSELKKLYDLYKKDFEIFSYPVPERLIVGKV